MIKSIFISLLLFNSLVGFSQFSGNKFSLGETDGMPLSNFAIPANISKSGTLYNGILSNPGQLGRWLKYSGKAELNIGYKSELFTLNSFDVIDNKRQFPISSIKYSKHATLPIEISLKSWAPIKVNDYFTTALPVIQTEIELQNNSDVNQEINLVWKLDEVFTAETKAERKGLSGKHIAFLGDINSEFKNDQLVYSVDLKPKERKTIRFAISTYDSLWVTSKKHHSALSVCNYAIENWNKLFQGTLDFDKALPLTNDSQLNDILRWYIVPAMILTKCTANDEIVTMGYNELNQRDSYWTSWLHLVLFKDAERKMIEESIDAIKPDGKVPTTILPKIERFDDLDINAFFILRFFRYVDFYKDEKFATQNWAKVKLAMDWLISRDKDKDGLPEQVSFWGDWKDVKGIEGRKYSPFSSLLYLAALKHCKQFAKKNDDVEAEKKYTKAFVEAEKKINTSFSKGGLWADGFYQQSWYDGRNDGKILQDQVIGVFFDVVSNKRAKQIFKTLNTNSRTPYGIAETFPYYESSFGYEPAEYHNGAVWPWLSFMDIWARLKKGRKDEAIQLIKDIAKADLYNSGDYMPNEHINSLNGNNLGFYIQGWNAALFGVFYFELK